MLGHIIQLEDTQPPVHSTKSIYHLHTCLWCIENMHNNITLNGRNDKQAYTSEYKQLHYRCVL